MYQIMYLRLHYFLCLHNIIGEGLYNTLEHDSLSKLNSSLNSFNVEEYLALQDNGDELLSKVNELFLGSQDIIECIDLISDQKIYKNELATVLQAIGYYAITIIYLNLLFLSQVYEVKFVLEPMQSLVQNQKFSTLTYFLQHLNLY